MSLLTCQSCSTRFAVGLEACPQCASTNFVEDAGPMLPMIEVACRTVDCRAQDKAQAVRLPSIGVNLVQLPTILCALCGAVTEVVTPWPPAAPEGDQMAKITRHGGPTNDNPPDDGVQMAAGTGEPADAASDNQEGGEESSAGSSSQTSTEKPPPSSETSEPASPKPARKTGSRSTKARTEASTARGTGGDPTEPTSETG